MVMTALEAENDVAESTRLRGPAPTDDGMVDRDVQAPRAPRREEREFGAVTP